jgi:hypothetical protein
MLCRPFGTRHSEVAARNGFYDADSRVIFHAYLGRHPCPAFSWTEGHSASIHRAGMFVRKDTMVPGFLGHLTLLLEPTRFSTIPTVLIRGTQPRSSKYLHIPDIGRRSPLFRLSFGFGGGFGVIHVEQENAGSYGR